VGVQEELRERREEKGKRKGERGKKFAIRTGITGLIKYQRCNACSCFILLFPLSPSPLLLNFPKSTIGCNKIRNQSYI
jgi:hypothetical protein